MRVNSNENVTEDEGAPALVARSSHALAHLWWKQDPASTRGVLTSLEPAHSVTFSSEGMDEEMRHLRE